MGNAPIQAEHRPRRRLIVFTITPWAAVVMLCCGASAFLIYLAWSLR